MWHVRQGSYPPGVMVLAVLLAHQDGADGTAALVALVVVGVVVVVISVLAALGAKRSLAADGEPRPPDQQGPPA